MRRLISLYFRGFISVLLILSLTVACGHGRSENQQKSTIESSSQTATQMRIVTHAMGETRVPLNPNRVMALGVLDYVLSLGVNPVGSTDTNESYLVDRSRGIATIGYQTQPNIESVLVLSPDLILSSNDWIDSTTYSALSQIAPTVLSSRRYGSDWKSIFFTQAEALGKIDEYEDYMENHRARIESFQQQMGDRLSKTQVSIVRVYPDKINLYFIDSFCGSVLRDAGLLRPPSQDLNAEQAFAKGGNYIQMSISKEVIEQADGDIIFVFTFGSTEEIELSADAAYEQLQVDPLWSRLSAVERGKVYRVPDYWIGEGPLAANLVLDDLFKYLIDEWED
ncbi:MAG: iron-siderophore ABC transporter substrate-binding protein [Synechococcaceae cyanobacterium SM2_3_2]|nr:iron-siderophore ABC transporter substrate-binding protein [Synechococcaceae cyanobacterium SM2_3_2]